MSAPDWIVRSRDVAIATKRPGLISRALSVEFEAPVYQCAACGKRQLRSAAEIRKALSHAMVGICDRAGFPHSG